MPNDTTKSAPDERAELKPCPFCGGDARLRGGPYAQESYSVWCSAAHGKSHHMDGNMSEADTVAAWNTRTPPQVKPLVWHKSHMRPWDGDYHTFPTCYTIRCADENGYKWTALGLGAHGYGHTPEGAKAAAQADYTRRILEALA